MTHPSKPNLNTKVIGIIMLVFAFACLLLDLLFSEGVPESLGVIAFSYLFVYGLAKLRHNQ
jgi:hypothetical protein